ncbi:unnamed protein product [Peniophora sp. CBMAI 1063]|nr:unnamed protein product [Peniophora sp. CBMAI 1063]
MSHSKESFDASPPDAEEGDTLWSTVLGTLTIERDQLLSAAMLTSTSTQTFAGLFGAVVATFLVDSYKQLSPPDNSSLAQGVNITNTLLSQLLLAQNITPQGLVDISPPFTVRKMDNIINTLFASALELALISALLVMMVLDWQSDAIRSQARPSIETIERYSLRRLHIYEALEHYGVDRSATFIFGLMHLAVMLFLLGLCLTLQPSQTFTGAMASAISGLALFAYVLASLIPLIDPQCPYYTPLSFIFHSLIYGGTSVVAFIVLSVANLIAALGSWVRNGAIVLSDASPRPFLRYLKAPILSARIAGPLMVAVLSRKSSAELDQISARKFAPPSSRKTLSGRQLKYLATRVKAHLVRSPEAMRYLARAKLDINRDGVSDILVNLRNTRAAMENLVVAFRDVDTVYAAEGSVRLLQMLLSADNPADLLTQARSNQDARWRHMAPILETFPAFAQRVGRQCAQALRQQDSTLHAAVASLRWTLIFSLGNIQGRPYEPEHPGFTAWNNIRSLLTSLSAVDGLRMCKVSSGDHENLDDLFGNLWVDPRLELASRNALSLLMAVDSCGWSPGAWQKPDETYVPTGSPGMWDWRRALPSRNERSDMAQDYIDVRDELWKAAAPSAGPDASNVASCALRALHDLETIVKKPEGRAPSIAESRTSGRLSDGPSHERPVPSPSSAYGLPFHQSEDRPDDEETKLLPSGRTGNVSPLYLK